MMVHKYNHSGFTLEEIRIVANELSSILPKQGVIAFHGEMGAGKTTLIKQLCSSFGVSDEVSSPTFGLINVYLCPGEIGVINHVDLYRLRDEEEAEDVGVFDLFNGKGLTFLEWPERIADNLPEDLWILKIERTLIDNERKLSLIGPESV
ncbi:MAG: tRNA (adenosine(37)-N6)-threonylcarbamoyltransferase complex ATPase subunit type 1 TsaE [Bacteroidetes bacterium]|nr:MAG: tRNA (adenosine(37)-N6)-threonylcarbamoyltransferase complex ATPase subunit type 1 TsaE [Bacteroidota bacterium]